MPGTNITDKFKELLYSLVPKCETQGQTKELNIVQVHGVQPHHVERPQLGVELVHLALPQQGGQLGAPEEGGREHGAGHQAGHQVQVGGHQLLAVSQRQIVEFLQSIFCLSFELKTKRNECLPAVL